MFNIAEHTKLLWFQNFYNELNLQDTCDVIAYDQYCHLTGILQFLARRLRPDMMLAVSILAQFPTKATKCLTECVSKVLVYPKLTGSYAVQYSHDGRIEGTLIFHSGSDFGGGRMSRKSRSGWMGSVYGFIFVWKNRNQTSVGVSAREAEYMSIFETFFEEKWMKTVLAKLGFELQCQAGLFCDITATNNWAQHSNSMKRAKRINLKYHCVKE